MLFALCGWQSKRNVGAALGCFGIPLVTRGNHDVLSPRNHVGCRCRDAGVGKRSVPQEFAGGAVKGTKLLIVKRRADEHDSADSNDWATVVFSSSFRQAFFVQFGVFPEW